MAIPITYNIRNLRLRLGATLMTALGIALTVAVAVFIMALLAGLKKAFVSSGDPLNVLVLRKGSQAELQSGIDRDAYGAIRYLPGIARDKSGEPLASGEVVVVIVIPVVPQRCLLLPQVFQILLLITILRVTVLLS